MKTFHGDAVIKEKYVARVKAHALADEIVKGQYWKDGKGCAVGCTIHSKFHVYYERELGIPEWLAKVEDVIFEGLPNEIAKEWPQQFLEVIPVGVDLEQIRAPFLLFVLESTLDKFPHVKFPNVKKAIDTVIELYRSKEAYILKFGRASAARLIARKAAMAAWEEPYATLAEADSAGAWAAAQAAMVAADADAVMVAEVATMAAVVAEYKKFAVRLLSLLKEAK